MNKLNEIIQSDLKEITDDSLPFEELSGRVVLIAGASGFLPAYMVESLLFLNQTRDLNIHVIGLVRDMNRAAARFSHHKHNKDLTLVSSNLETIPILRRQPDYIIHAASAASPLAYGKDPVGTILANTVGTLNLLKLGQRANSKKFLYFSSSEVYGKVSSEVTELRENCYGAIDPLDVRSCYSESKRLGENLCTAWWRQFGLPSTIVRPFHTYGPGMKLDDGRVFADFVSDIVNHRDIVMSSDGKAERSFCYLSDAVRAFFNVLLSGSPGEAYNVGNPAGHISILGLAELLCSLYPERGLRVIKKPLEQNSPYLPSKIGSSRPEVSKLKQKGWQPRYSLREGFSRTIRSFEYEIKYSGKTVPKWAS